MVIYKELVVQVVNLQLTVLLALLVLLANFANQESNLNFVLQDIIQVLLPKLVL